MNRVCVATISASRVVIVVGISSIIIIIGVVRFDVRRILSGVNKQLIICARTSRSGSAIIARRSTSRVR